MSLPIMGPGRAITVAQRWQATRPLQASASKDRSSASRRLFLHLTEQGGGFVRNMSVGPF
jgi:hypothetical protein